MLAENLVAQNISFLSGFGNCSSIGIDSDFQTGNLQACKHFLFQVLLLKISCCCAVENKEEIGRGCIQNFCQLSVAVFVYLFIGCAVSSLLCRLSLLVANGGYLHCGAWASHCSGFSCFGAQTVGS